MQYFSIDSDAISLPRGAWAKAHRLNVSWRGRPIAALSQGEYRAYLFPVYTPAGFAITSESPIDHPHHNSLWIGADHFHCHLPFSTNAYEEATYNFYVNDTFQGRAPGHIVSVSVEETEVSESHLRLIQTLNWQGPSEWGAPQGRILAVETRTIDIYPGETANLIDIRSQLSPTDWDIKIGRTRHAYFGVRMVESLRATAGATLIDADGRSGGTAISGGNADWVDCSGQIAVDRYAGVALFRYPSTASASWYIADWGTLAVNPFSREGRMIKDGEVLDLAVRVIVHDGDTEAAGIEGLYQRFIQEVGVKPA